VLLEVAQDWVIDGENIEEFANDGDADRVGIGRRVVVPFHGSVEISEYRMEFACFRVDSRIWAVQVGEPLGDGSDGVTNCASSDRFTLLASFTVAESEDQEVAEDVFGKHCKSRSGTDFQESSSANGALNLISFASHR
jgi:hypothetical protein